MLVFMEIFSYFLFSNFKFHIHGSISQEENVQTRRVKKIYGSTGDKYTYKLPDIVVLELDEPFVLVPDIIEPACLPTQGGFQLLDLIITELKSHMTCLKIQGLSSVEILFVKKMLYKTWFL